MKLQRVLTGIIGLPIVALILILGNKFIWNYSAYINI